MELRRKFLISLSLEKDLFVVATVTGTTVPKTVTGTTGTCFIHHVCLTNV